MVLDTFAPQVKYKKHKKSNKTSGVGGSMGGMGGGGNVGGVNGSGSILRWQQRHDGFDDAGQAYGGSCSCAA